MSSKEDGIMIVLSSPSGAGKTTLTKLLANSNDYLISVSHTTRKPRINESNAEDYYFVNEQEFNSLVENNNFYEFAKIFGNYYGTLKKPVIKHLSEGKDVLFDIDWQGTQQLKKISNLSLVTFFIVPPNIEVLKKRLLNRHKGQESLIKPRMMKFHEELSHWKEYDYVVVNDDLEICYTKILKIITNTKNGINEKQDLSVIEKKVKELFS